MSPSTDSLPVPGPLILASASPRRQELLRQAGIPFVARPTHIPELELHHLPEDSAPATLAESNAHLKASTCAQSHHGSIVLGADTVVALHGKCLGKPSDLDEARHMLAELSGHEHEVITGLCLVKVEPPHQPQIEAWSVTTRVRFRSLTPEIIERYIQTVHVLDKAGGYALQEHGDWIISDVTGSPSNVVGLPMEGLRERLALWIRLP
jgi:septum formation protein